ncbi:MAG: hypothetical protein GX041_02685 [Clostridiales bacterium]|jgi:hypothetical protein|nr:hypothetical protein [Clostridiales bacterium]
MPKRKRIRKDDNMEDILLDKSAYGEFVSTFHAWTGLEGTHKRGAELQDKGKTKIRHRKAPDKIKTKEE